MKAGREKQRESPTTNNTHLQARERTGTAERKQEMTFTIDDSAFRDPVKAKDELYKVLIQGLTANGTKQETADSLSMIAEWIRDTINRMLSDDDDHLGTVYYKGDIENLKTCYRALMTLSCDISGDADPEDWIYYHDFADWKE